MPRKRNEKEINELKQNIYINNNGEQAQIINYINCKNITIQFENGIIREHVDLCSLQKGSFSSSLTIKNIRQLELDDLDIKSVNYDGRRYQGFKTGIHQDKNGNWHGEITINSNKIYLGQSKNKDDILKLRNEYINKIYPEDIIEGEKWLKISEFNNYSVSNLGRIRNDINGYILKGDYDKNGYKRFILCKDGKQYNRRLCRLVAKEFVPNPNNYPIVNHKDENKNNDCAENLEWCTIKYNNNYGSRLKTLRKPVICVETQVIYEGCRDAERKTGICHAYISRAARLQKLAGGYHWRFIING